MFSRPSQCCYVRQNTLLTQCVFKVSAFGFNACTKTRVRHCPGVKLGRSPPPPPMIWAPQPVIGAPLPKIRLRYLTDRQHHHKIYILLVLIDLNGWCHY